MPLNDIKTQTDVIQVTEVANDVSTVTNQNDTGIRIIGLNRGFSFLIIVVGLIVGIRYMIKNKKTKAKRIIVGTVIIIASFIFAWIIPVILDIIIWIILHS